MYDLVVPSMHPDDEMSCAVDIFGDGEPGE